MKLIFIFFKGICYRHKEIVFSFFVLANYGDFIVFIFSVIFQL